MKIRFIFQKVLISVCLLALLAVSVSAVDTIYEGSCGDNLTWELTQEGTLTISGLGDMDNSHPWTRYQNQIKKVIIADGVTSIGWYAFQNCQYIQSVELPEGLSSIGPSAFNGCTRLESLILPASLDETGAASFSNCTALKEILVKTGNPTFFSEDGILYKRTIAPEMGEVPQRIECYPAGKSETTYTIPDNTGLISYAFEGCKNLTNIAFPSSYTDSSLDNTFEGCTALKNIDIPTSVKYIGYRTFYNCSNLSVISIPSGVVEISNNAFTGCNSLEKIYYDGTLVNWRAIYNSTELDSLLDCKEGNELSGNVTDTIHWSLNDKGLLKITGSGEMPDYSQFDLNSRPWDQYATAVKNIEIGQDIIHIGDYAFETFPKLQSVTLSNSVKSIGNSAFAFSPELTKVIGGSMLENIGDSAFQYCSNLATFSLPDELLFIGRNAFENCNLAQVCIPAQTTSILSGAFSGNPQLTAIDVQSGNKDYCTDDGILFNKNKTKLICYPNGKNATSYNIPETVITIDDYAFLNCTQLENVSLPDGLLYIGSEDGEGAFYGCSGLETIIIPTSVQLIGGEAFGECTRLNNVVLPNKVIVGNHAFADCKSLSNITIPNDVTEIGACAFQGCETLIDVQLPTDIMKIERGLFYGCTALKNIEIPSNVQYIGQDAFFACEALSNILIPKSVRSIDQSAFMLCKSLNRITLVNGIERIESYAFSGSGLEDVLFPSTVTYIGENIFEGCADINRITILNPKCNINTNQNIVKTVVLHGAANSTTQAIANNNGYVFTPHDYVIDQVTNTKTCKVCGDIQPYNNGSSGGSIGGGSAGGGGASTSDSSTNPVLASTVLNGKVSLDKNTAKKGDTVTVTATPDKGYKLDKLTVTDAKGNTVDVTDLGNGKFSFVMPEGKVTVTPTFVADNGGQTDSKSFSDVKSSDWFADAVQYVTDKGLMNGTGDNKFSPNASTTRGMLMTVLARYAGEDTTGSTPWYQKGMEWAKTNGVSDGTNPEVNITREQLVTMLYRYAGSPAADGKLDSFTDSASVSSYAVNAMQWAVANGIVNGFNGKLNPQNNATRAEVAAILMRFCGTDK